MNLEEKQMKADDLLAVINSAQKMRDELLAEIKNEKEIENIKHDVFAMVYHTNALIERYGLDLPSVKANYINYTNGDNMVELWCASPIKFFNVGENKKDSIKAMLVKYICEAVHKQIIKSI